MDLFEERAKSHKVRSQLETDFVINENGAVFEEYSEPSFGSKILSRLKEGLSGYADHFDPGPHNLIKAKDDAVNIATGTARAVGGGVQDTVENVVGLSGDIAGYIESKLGIENKYPHIGDSFTQGLKNAGIHVPEGNSPAENLARGLVQFAAGMGVAPIKGTSLIANMGRGAFADALFDPEGGNLSTLINEYGLGNFITEFLDSSVDEDAEASERLAGRLKAAVEGTGVSIPIDLTLRSFRAARSDEGLKAAIKGKLQAVGERLNQPGEMPDVGMNAGQLFQGAEPVKVDADEAVNVLNLRAEQMELAPKDRVQPSGEVMFDTSAESYARTFPEQIETPVPRAPEGKALPLGDRARKVIEMSDVISDKLAERAKPFVGTNVQFFYNTGPIIDKAIELGYSKEQAFEALRKFALNYAATSPRTKTEENLRSASLAGVKQERGIDIGTIIGPGGSGINEKGYPMIINPGGLHRKLLDDVMASGISFDTNPKPATFAENVSGNLAGVTVDTHAIRAVFDVLNELEPGSIPLKFIGGKTAAKTKEFQEMYQKDPSSFDAATMVADTLQSQKIDGKDMQTEYAVFSDIYKQVAEKLGVKPAEAQSLSWFANGDKTGLASEPKTIVELIDDRVDVTAQLTGMSKDEVFKKFFQGSIPLLSLGGGITLLESGASITDGESL